MVGPVSPACPHLPEIWREDNDRQQKKNAHYLEPDDAAHTAEWPQKGAHAAGNPSGGLASHLAGYAALFGTDCGWLGGMRVGGRFSVGGYLLAGNFSSDPQPHPYHAAYLIRFHLDYDGSSDA